MIRRRLRVGLTVLACATVAAPGTAFAGTVLHSEHDPDLPWFRIVRADGSLTQGARQRKLLEAEGVPFRGDKVDMRAARVP